MSFDFNLSSDEEDLDEWTRREGFLPHRHSQEDHGNINNRDYDDNDHYSLTEVVEVNTAQASSSASARVPAAAASLGGNDFDKPLDGDTEDDDGEDDSVDWEDVEMKDQVVDNNDDDDRKPAAIDTNNTSDTGPENNIRLLRPITVNLDNDENQPANKRRKVVKARQKFGVDSLPHDLQALMQNLHYTNLLALTSLAWRMSHQASAATNNTNNEQGEEPLLVLALALSLVPDEFDINNHSANVNEAKRPSNDNDDKDHHYPEWIIPTLGQLQKLCQWYFGLIHEAHHRRQARFRQNRAAGAPRMQRRSRRRQQERSNISSSRGRRRKNANSNDEEVTNENDTYDTYDGKSAARPASFAPTMASIPRLMDYATYLSNSISHDPHFGEESLEIQNNTMQWNAFDQNQLLLAMLRSLGWRARFVLAIDPMKCHSLDVDHPLLAVSRNVFQCIAQNNTKTDQHKSTKRNNKKKSSSSHASLDTPNLENEKGWSKPTPTAPRPMQMGWIEVLCRDARQPNKFRWIHVDPANQLVNQPDQVEGLLKDIFASSSPAGNGATRKHRAVLSYAIAVEHSMHGAKFTDVTPRYAHSFVSSLRQRGLLRGRGQSRKRILTNQELRTTWWGKTIEKLNQHFYLFTNNKAEASKANTVQINLKSKGNSTKDAIAVDSSDDEGKRKEKKSDDKPTVDDLFQKADDDEKKDLHESALNEAIPTSKAAFQTHPVYVLKSVLGNAEVLAPDASKRVCGVFKGEMVYRRSDVSTAYPARKWPYLGRKVRPDQLEKPIKRVKARKKPAPKTFKALKSYGFGSSNDGSEQRRSQDIFDATQPLEDGMERLYAEWQTDAWSPPPVGPTDPIPVNEHNNIEKELLNPGLVHIDERGMAIVAKKLGIPYAPCMLGFEGHGGNRTPTVRGIVVHAHNEEIVREAGVEVMSHELEQENANRRKLILLRWKKLLRGLLIKDRVEREYGDDS